MARPNAAAVKELQDKCGLSAAQCRKALQQHGGDVDATLAALIDARRIRTKDLNTETVADELFTRAARLEAVKTMDDLMPKLTEGLSKLAGLPSPKSKRRIGEKLDEAEQYFADLVEGLKNNVFDGATAEEIVEEEERDRVKRVEKLQDIIPAFKKAKPLSLGESARIWARTQRRSAQLKARPVTLRMRPFPPLKMTLSEWEGKDVWPAWAGTQQRFGGYCSVSSTKPSKGTVVLHIPRIDKDDAKPKPPARFQVAAYAYLKDNGDEVASAVLEGLLEYYTKLRAQWLEHDPKLDLPVSSTVNEMRQNVGIGNVFVHSLGKGGFAYVGLELGCTWDEEHGAGVLLHKSSVIDVGQADSAFSGQAAMKDAKKPVVKGAMKRKS